MPWGQRHSGLAVVLGSSGARLLTTTTLLFATGEFGRIFIEDNDVLCRQAALVITKHALCGEWDTKEAQAQLLKLM